MKTRNLVLALMIPFLIVLSSCQHSDFNKQYLLGEWKVAEWTIESTGQVRNNKMDFTFNEDDTYMIDYGSETEKGRYWLANEYLHTVEENKTEKKVKVIQLSQDTMRFQMNRGGELENVLLTR